MDIVLTQWQQLIRYCNKHKAIKRSELLRTLPCTSSIDCYRNYLTQAGYLRIVSRGVYAQLKHIPTTLTLRKCRQIAYKKI
jgi:hypothetical protein